MNSEALEKSAGGILLRGRKRNAEAGSVTLLSFRVKTSTGLVLYRSSAGNQLNYKDDHGQDKQYVNKTT